MSGCNQRAKCCCVSYATVMKGGLKWWVYSDSQSNYGPFPVPTANTTVFADSRLWQLGPVYMGSNVSIPAVTAVTFNPATYGFTSDRNILGVQMDAKVRIQAVINGSSQDPSVVGRAGCGYVFDYGRCNVPTDPSHGSYTITQDPATRILTLSADAYAFHLWTDNVNYPLKTKCGPFEYYYGPVWLRLILELYPH